MIITGPPYSGKGTQCKILVEQMAFGHVSTGELCRNEKLKGSAVGKKITQYEESGDLVPDDIMKTMVSSFLEENLTTEKTIILDGYPRTKKQVDDLLTILNEKKVQVHSVLNIEVPTEELLLRAEERAKTSTRKDDQNPETHKKRVTVFEEETKPAIDYLSTKFNLISVDGLGSIDQISRRIQQEVS